MTSARSSARRNFLKALAAGATGAAAVPWKARGAHAVSAAPATKPNLLVIMSDEHQWALAGCYGNKLVKTPVLDALAARGIIFDNAYTNSPLCVPCRLSFTAGKYISRVGAWSNSSWLPSDDLPSLPSVLNAAGYETVLCGKMHYDRTRRYGFQTDLGIGNNSFKTGKGGRRKPDDLAHRGLSARFENFRVGDDNKVMAHDRQVTEAAVPFLRKRRRADKPFFMLAGYVAPHFPLIVPDAYWRPYQGRVPLPTIPAGHLDTLPLNYKHLRVGFQNDDVPEDVVRLGRELYYGFVTWLDEQIGILVKTLGDSEVAENTVVIYTTDHGENLGEHGLWWKNAVYDSAARIPLIVSWPARWAGGQRRTGVCSLVDVVQTLVQLAGAEAPADWDGDSLVPLLDDPQAPWKDRAVSQYYAHNIASGYCMLRQGKYKYVYHSPPAPGWKAEEELYDLVADPGEFTNLARRPEHRARCKQMLADLIEELGEHPDAIEARARQNMTEGYGRTQPSAAPNDTLRNKRFENKLNYWSPKGNAGRYALAPDVGRGNSTALQYTGPEPGQDPTQENSHLDQDLRVEPQTTYTFGGWVKAEGDLKPLIRLASVDFKTIATAVAGPSRDWQEIRGSFDSGEHTQVKFQIFGGSLGKEHQTAPGRSYLDDLFFEKTVEDA